MPPRQRYILALFVVVTALALALLSRILLRPEQAVSTDIALPTGGYLSEPRAQWLALAALAPVLLALAFAWRHERPALDYLQPELFGAFGVWVSLANAYAVAYALPLLGLLPRFDPPPTTLTDSRLAAVPLNWLAVTAIALTILFYVWFLFLRPRGVSGLADRIRLPHRRVALLILFTGLAAAVWVFGGLGFAWLIVPSAWLWIHIEPHKSGAVKTLNAVLALGGIAPFALLAARLNPWQIVLAAAYGALHPIDVLMFFLLAALFIRFLRLGLSAPYMAPPPLPTQSEILDSLLR